MTSASACRNTSLVALALAVAPLVACTAPLVVGDHNDDPQPAIALAYEDLQGWLRPDPEAPDADPTALYIQIDSQTIDCDDQSALDPAVCATGWHLSIAIPPDYVAPGTYDFADPAVRVVLLQGEQSGSECTGELGPLTEGTLKIESIDLEGMEVRLDTSALPEAEGRYRVSRCLLIPVMEANMRALWIAFLACGSSVGLVACGDDAGTGGRGGTGGGGAPSSAGGPLGGSGPGAGGTGGAGGAHASALECDPLEARVAGMLEGAPIDESFTAFGAMNTNTLHADFGERGALHLELQGPDTAPMDATGFLRMPDDSAQPGAWVCVGEGSTIVRGDDWRTASATFRSLSTLGACPGEPVTGTVSACFGDDTCETGLTSTLEGASFDLPFDSYFVTGLALIGSPQWDFEAVPDPVMGFVAMHVDDIDLLSTGRQTTELPSGYLILPDGVPDARAVYCIGPGSTIDYEMVEGTPDVLRATFASVSRLGACPGAGADGELQYCQRGAE